MNIHFNIYTHSCCYWTRPSDFLICAFWSRIDNASLQVAVNIHLLIHFLIVLITGKLCKLNEYLFGDNPEDCTRWYRSDLRVNKSSYQLSFKYQPWNPCKYTLTFLNEMIMSYKARYCCAKNSETGLWLQWW